MNAFYTDTLEQDKLLNLIITSLEFIRQNNYVLNFNIIMVYLIQYYYGILIIIGVLPTKLILYRSLLTINFEGSLSM